MFCDLSSPELAEINQFKGCSSFTKGQVIFQEGSRPTGLFCMSNGKVKVSKIGDDGKDQIVRLAREGDILGYRALLSGDSYSSSAIALDDCKICFIPKTTIFSIIEKNASLALHLMKLLSSDLKNAEEKITTLAQKPVRERVAESLLFLKETYGFESDNATINVCLTREEIANIVGTATETVIRLLSEFKQDGIVELNGKKIRVLNLTRLVKTANIID